MLEAARLIRAYTHGISYDIFRENREKQDAVSLRITVLGEAAGKIDSATEAALPGIPFKRLRGMRNRIAHDYGAIDFEIVWDVIERDIGPLIVGLGGFLGLG